MNNSMPGSIIVKAFIQDVLQPLGTYVQPGEELQAACDFAKSMAAFLDSNSVDELLGAGALHPAPEVRRAMVDIASVRFDTSEVARQFLIWSLRDTDEQAAIAAIRTCALSNNPSVWSELYTLLGRVPSRIQTQSAFAPMSLREAAAIQIFQQYQQKEGAINLNQLDPNLMNTSEENTLVLNRSVDLNGMVKIDAGRFVCGISDTEGMPGWFALDEVMPDRVIELKEFYIDKESVTNDEYDAFCEAVEEDGHLWCHPDESPEKNHRRSTWGDARVDGDHPVSGVDWYDAFSYSAWQGKTLPTAEQWEKAARGTDGQRYPWGDVYDTTCVNDADRAYGKTIQSVEDLLRVAAAFSLMEPHQLTVPSALLSANISPFGVQGMVGNTWEWTRTTYLSREDVAPHFRGLDPAIAMEDWSSYVVVKGGAWSSKAELLLPAYQGRSHIFFRSPDVGFRCVYEP